MFDFVCACDEFERGGSKNGSSRGVFITKRLSR